MKREEKMWGAWHIIYPLSEKVGMARPPTRVPHLIAPMTPMTVYGRVVIFADYW